MTKLWKLLLRMHDQVSHAKDWLLGILKENWLVNEDRNYWKTWNELERPCKDHDQAVLIEEPSS